MCDPRAGLAGCLSTPIRWPYWPYWDGIEFLAILNWKFNFIGKRLFRGSTQRKHLLFGKTNKISESDPARNRSLTLVGNGFEKRNHKSNFLINFHRGEEKIFFFSILKFKIWTFSETDQLEWSEFRLGNKVKLTFSPLKVLEVFGFWRCIVCELYSMYYILCTNGIQIEIQESTMSNDLLQVLRTY